MHFTMPVLKLERWVPIMEELDWSALPADYLNDILVFADSVGKLDSLLAGFENIVRLSKNAGPAGKGKVFTDFAPQSFAWTAMGMTGGLIFHGAHDNGGDGGAPTLSVCLTPTDGWSIHT